MSIWHDRNLDDVLVDWMRTGMYLAWNVKNVLDG